MDTTFLLADLLTIHDICELFGVKQMSIWSWRHRPSDPLPAIVIPGNKRHTLRFKFDDVEAWGIRNNKKMPGITSIRKYINGRLPDESGKELMLG